MPLVVESHGLSHQFGKFRAVRDVDLAVPSEAVYGFLGPNGSGKTTTIRILLGLLRPRAGQVLVLGLPMPAARREIARSVGAIVEAPCLYDHLSGFDNVDLTRRALGLPRRETERVLELVELAPFAKRRAGAYSLGMRQRLGIARALLGGPRLLILDEPMNGLDPPGVLDMRRLIRDLPAALGVTVFVSSHLLGEVEQVATHVGLMFHGRLVAQSPLHALLASTHPVLLLGVREAARAASRLRAARIDCSVDGDAQLVVPLPPGRAPDPVWVNAFLVREGFDVRSLHRRTPSLEDVFMRHTVGMTA